MSWEDLLKALQDLKKDSPELLEARVEMHDVGCALLDLSQSLTDGSLFFSMSFVEDDDEEAGSEDE